MVMKLQFRAGIGLYYCPC